MGFHDILRVRTLPEKQPNTDNISVQNADLSDAPMTHNFTVIRS
jgi:hypothetical protein